MSDTFERVTPDKPCDVCKSPGWCVRLSRYHLCMRIKSATPCESGGWLHVIENQTDDKPPVSVQQEPKKPRFTDEQLDATFRPIAEQAVIDGRRRLYELADKLGVDKTALIRLQCGFVESRYGGYYTFPEKNADGLIVGITKRLVTPLSDGRNKICMKGGRRGLFYARDWAKDAGELYLVEGASDCCAAMTMGWCVIGRPSNTGGVAMLSKMLSSWSRRIVVLGERDQKANGRWPGLEGALATAKALATRLGKQVEVEMPPRPHKDLRNYVKQTRSHANSSMVDV